MKKASRVETKSREGGRASKCRPTAAGVPVPDKAEDDDGDNEAVGVSD